MIDIGGESTRPGYTPIDLSEELSRVLPCVFSVSGLGIPVSIDTYKPGVARSAIASVESVHGPVQISQSIDCSLQGQCVPEALRSVLENLLDNAVRASPSDSPVRLCLTRSASELVCSVEDFGAGMSAATVRAAFVDGFSGRSPRLGVGLAISRRVIEELGGQLSLKSEKGRGTRASFRVSLL